MPGTQQLTVDAPGATSVHSRVAKKPRPRPMSPGPSQSDASGPTVLAYPNFRAYIDRTPDEEGSRERPVEDLATDDLWELGGGIQSQRYTNRMARLADPRTGSRQRARAEKAFVAENILATIDTEIDLSADADRVDRFRDFSVVPAMMLSCLNPLKSCTWDEKGIYEFLYEDIDRDCDQVRAMVANLIRYSSKWSLESFRRSLTWLERAPFYAFLRHRGKRGGVRSRAYQLIWEFFKKRELLNVPLPTAAAPEQLDIKAKAIFDSPELIELRRKKAQTTAA